MSRELLKRVLEQLRAKINPPYALIREIKAELVKPEPVPVGIITDCKHNGLEAVLTTDTWNNYECLKAEMLLYTQPPAQKKPLTNDEIDNLPYHSIPSDFDKSLRRFARLIEKHHGIGEK